MEFEEFENILKKTINDFRDINKLGLIAIAGSLDMRRDLDLIIFPSKGIKKGNFLKVLVEFLEDLRLRISKLKDKLIVIPYSYFEEEVKYLSGGVVGKDVLLHISSFPDIDLTTKNIVKNYLKNSKIYHGQIKDILNIQKTNLDYYYNYLFITNCLLSNYPKQLETQKIHERISYIYKNNGRKLDIDKKSNKKIFFECCNFLDSTAKWKN